GRHPGNPEKYPVEPAPIELRRHSAPAAGNGLCQREPVVAPGLTTHARFAQSDLGCRPSSGRFLAPLSGPVSRCGERPARVTAPVGMNAHSVTNTGAPTPTHPRPK